MLSNNNLDLLFRLQNSLPPCPIEFVGYDPAYEINLNTREIETPRDVVIKKDHNAVTFYFVVDRFYDYVDLSTTNCVITYNIDDSTYFYPIPYYDIYSLKGYGKMIIPWHLSEVVTQNSGRVEFSFQFYKIKGEVLDDAEMVYSLHTKPTSFSVARGLDAKKIEYEDTNGDWEVTPLGCTLTFNANGGKHTFKPGDIINVKDYKHFTESEIKDYFSFNERKQLYTFIGAEEKEFSYSYLGGLSTVRLSKYADLYSLIDKVEKLTNDKRQCYWIIKEDTKTIYN